MEEKILDLPEFCKWLFENYKCIAECDGCAISYLMEYHELNMIDFSCILKYNEEDIKKSLY